MVLEPQVSVIRKADSETLGKVAQAVTEQACLPLLTWVSCWRKDSVALVIPKSWKILALVLSLLL